MAGGRRYMKSLLLVLLQLQLVQNNEAGYLCQTLNPQNCSKLDCTPASFSLVCPKLQNGNWDSTLRIDVKTNNVATLECSKPNMNYEWLNDVLLGQVESLEIRSCPLPNKSLHALLQSLNVTGIKKISIQQSTGNFTLDNQYFRKLELITHLLMPGNGLNELPPTIFQDMTNLSNLDLHANNLSLLNNELTPLINLRKLELGKNNIEHLSPGAFRNLKKLDFLNLWGNKLNNITNEVFQSLQNLTSLDLSSNTISVLPANTFAGLKKLKILYLFSNNFTSLPENLLSGMDKLEVVKLQNNARLKTLPRELFAHLPSLREINLSRCNLSIVPNDILWGSLNVSKVDFSNNFFTTLPEKLFQETPNLEELDLSKNDITSLPDEIFIPLTKLRFLKMGRNQMTYINEELFHTLQSLEILEIHNNHLQEVHIYAFQEMTNLRHLNMSNNKLTFQPKVKFTSDASSPLQKCTNLQVLDLSHNNIQEMFSDWMWILKKLEQLDLSYNNFTSFTAYDLQFLSSTIVVDLQYNNIAHINLRVLELIFSHMNPLPGTAQVPIFKLGGNKLQCECEVYDILRYIENKMRPAVYKKVKMELDGLTCAGPHPVAGFPITKFNSQTFICPEKRFTQTCPTYCRCFNWPAERHLIVNCAGAGLMDIPKDLLSPSFRERPSILILDNNSLNSLPEEAALSHSNITKLSLSYNSISWIDDKALPASLKELKIDHNNITHLNSSLLDQLINRTNVTLHNNPWSCDCESLDFLSFLQASFKQVDHLYNITCNDGRILTRLTAEDICPYARTIIVATSTTIAVIGIIIGFLAALYFRYQNEVKVWLYAHNMCLWFVTEDELDKDKIYDAFISYSHQDEDFVTTKLLPELENGKPSFKICVHYRDWVVGEFITTQIARSVEDSKRTIVVLSPNFIKSEWGRLEFRAAHKQALTEKRARVIVVVYGELQPLEGMDSELRTYLTTNTYVKWGDPWFWDKLRYALPHQRKPQHRSGCGIDKLELINSPVATKATTPPVDIAINPLEVIKLGNKKSRITSDLSGYANKAYSDNAVKCM